MSGVVISGASRGLGYALASEFAGRGHKVFAGVRDNASVPEGTQAITLNIRDEDQINAAIDELAQSHSIDIVINNAGHYVGGKLTEVAQDDFKHVFDVNVLGVWRLTRAALRHMRPGGTIVMISSLSGLVGLPEDGPYAASKFALEGMSQSLAGELESKGIRVIVIEPGGIATGFAGNENGDTPADIAQIIADIVEGNGEALRYPVGTTASEIARLLELDTGAKAEAIVRNVTGSGWAKG